MSSRPSTAAPPRVASAQRVARRQRMRRRGRRAAAAAPAAPRPAGGWRRSTRCRRRRGRRARPRRSIARTGAMPEREAHVRASGSARRRCRVAREARDAGGVELDAVRVPDVGADPAERLGVLGRRAAEALAAVGDVVVVLGEVGVQAARRRRARARAVSRIRSRETENGEQGASAIRTIACGRGSWKASMTRCESARIAASLSTSASGGRPPALSPTLIEPRQAWKRMPIAGGGLERVVEPAAVGIEVEVVAGRGAAGQQQLGEAGQRRDADHLRRQPRPDRIERAQPVEEARVLRRRQRAGQRLEQVVVGVDEAGQEDVPGQVDDVVGRSRQGGARPDRLDQVTAHEDAAVDELGAGVVHRRHRGSADQERAGAHVRPSLGWLQCSRSGRPGARMGRL